MGVWEGLAEKLLTFSQSLSSCPSHTPTPPYSQTMALSNAMGIDLKNYPDPFSIGAPTRLPHSVQEPS